METLVKSSPTWGEKTPSWVTYLEVTRDAEIGERRSRIQQLLTTTASRAEVGLKETRSKITAGKIKD